MYNMIRSGRPRSWNKLHPVVSVRKRTRNCFYHELSFSKNGDPKEVIRYQIVNDDVDAGTRDSFSGISNHTVFDTSVFVRVEMLAAPWNPADMNTVQGRYPSLYKKPLSADHNPCSSRYFPGSTVVGSEGWGRITDIRFSDSSRHNDGKPLGIEIGDFVTIGLPGMGTMRSSVWLPMNAVIHLKRGKELYNYCLNEFGKDGLAAVSTMFQLGGTALRLLRDFESLEDGDVVIQNAGNSGVGFLLSQLAASADDKKTIHPVSLVRRGHKTTEQYDAMVEHLSKVGKNSIVVAEEDIIQDTEALKQLQHDIKQLSNSNELPKLGVNGVGGESASLLLKLIGPGRTLVTYGGMSMKPVTIGTAQLIFKDVRALGYWHSRWMVKCAERGGDYDLRKPMIDELVDLLLNGGITNAPTRSFPLSQISEALRFEHSQSAVSIREKVAFDCTEY